MSNYRSGGGEGGTSIVQFGYQFAMWSLWCSDVPCVTQFLKIVYAGAGYSIGATSTMQNDIRYDHQRAEEHAIH